jgi:hypothetical protein
MEYVFMKKRISIKKHKEYLMSALYFASMSNEIRPKLLNKDTQSININCKSICKTENSWAYFHKWNLEYIVETAQENEITEFPFFEGCVLFKCYSKQYSWIKAYSGINPDVETT